MSLYFKVKYNNRGDHTAPRLAVVKIDRKYVIPTDVLTACYNTVAKLDGESSAVSITDIEQVTWGLS